MSFQSRQNQQQQQNIPLPPPPPPPLPVAQLESLKFKANQIIESINALAFQISGGMHPGYMPPWPEILSKYNIIMSQTHNFSNALVNPFPAASVASARQGTTSGPPENIYQRIVVHPNKSMSDAQMDSEIGPLLRNQQTVEVSKDENECVRRLAEHMSTKGSLGVLGLTSTDTKPVPDVRFHLNGLRGVHHLAPPPKPEYEDVIRECAEIQAAHDSRVDRAIRAVLMLRDRFFEQPTFPLPEVPEHEHEELEWGRHSPVDEDMGSSDDEEEEEEEEAQEDEGEGGEGDQQEDEQEEENDVDDIQGMMEELDRQSSPPPVGTPQPQAATPAQISTPVPPAPVAVPSPAPPPPVARPPVIEIDDDDEPPLASLSQPRPPPPPSQSQGPRPDVEIIDLT